MKLIRKLFLVFLLLFSLGSQAQSLGEIATSPTTYAVCKTIDIVSTYYLLQHGFVELNPIVQASLAYGWLPLILSGVIVWYILDKTKDDRTTAVLNSVTCGVGLHNLLLIP